MFSPQRTFNMTRRCMKLRAETDSCCFFLIQKRVLFLFQSTQPLSHGWWSKRRHARECTHLWWWWWARGYFDEVFLSLQSQLLVRKNVLICPLYHGKCSMRRASVSWSEHGVQMCSSVTFHGFVIYCRKV